MFRRLFCLLSAFAVLFSISAPAFATGMEMGGAGVPVGVGVQLDVVDFFNYCRDDLRYCWNSIRHVVDEDVCPYAPQAGGRHEFEAVRTMVNGQIGLYYQCKHCGRNYGDALDEAYQDYVETLPGTQYNSDGAYLWVPGAADFVPSNIVVKWAWDPANQGNAVANECNMTLNVASSYPSVSKSGSTAYGAYTNTALAYIGDYVWVSTSNRRCWPRSCVSWGSVRVPVNGVYTVVPSVLSSSLAGSFSAGQTVSLGLGVVVSVGADGLGYLPWPAFWVTPYTGGSGGNTYEVATRVSGSASDGGLFGYVQDGQLYQSTVDTIYNETTNVYSNPITGDTSTISAWSYDYSDRSYSLTTNEGDSISVTYGDSSVVINEGGTTYNVYYLVEEPEDVQEDTSHTHSFSGAITTPPTCTGTGVRTLTCTECGWQTTETIPATGHSYSASVVTTPPTCTVPGIRTGTCTICGDEATEPIPATGHSYSSAITAAPTCMATGVRTYTCSGCGSQYTESIPATGHTWQAVSTAPTQYDDVTGQLLQAGYTLYRCAICGEEYRIDAASGGSSLPAPSSDGVSVSGDTDYDIDSSVGRGFLATIAHGLTEDLPGALEAASQWFTVLPAFYAGFTAFLKDGVAGCLPDVPRLMMGFGMGMVTFIGILRKIFGR